ncbi:MAG: polysaccharide biosynthesis tyrosine autokinase [Gemmatimonadota bacterium]
MEPDPTLPYPERSSQAAPPHLADYWEIVQRRLWLVFLIAALASGAALWVVGRQPRLFRSTLSLQVNDPWQRSRSLTSVPGFGADGFIDPIRSEIEVLGSTPIAAAVVQDLGLRVQTITSPPLRSALFRDARVEPGVPPQALELAYLDGNEVALVAPDGRELARGRVGAPLTAPGLSLTPLPNPGDGARYGLRVRTETEVVDEVRFAISASARESTNIIDVGFVGTDPELVAAILDGAARALRAYGARRVAGQASREVEFIEQRLDSAYAQLGKSLQDIREFKESQAFTDLSVQEQTLVTQSEGNAASIATLELQRSALSAVLRQVERGDATVDQVRIVAELPIEINPQIREVAGRLQTRKEELQRLVTTEAKTGDHPEVMGLQQQVDGLERQLVAAVQSNLTAVENRLQLLGRERSSLRDRQRQFPGLENQLATLELQQNLDRGTYEYLLSQLYQARIAEAGASPYVEVLDPASIPTPTGARPGLALLLGAMLGVLLGISGAFFLEYLDRTLRTSTQVRTALGLPVLGIVPELPHAQAGSRNGNGRPLLIAMDPGDPAAEAYRALRLNLAFSDGDRTGVRTVAFTSPGPNEGKSTSAVNLAVLIARQRERILLVDADLRRPALHLALGLPRQPGLADVLAGTVTLDDALQIDVLPNLDVLTAGPSADSPSDLLTSRAMEDLLAVLESRYNYVIVDSPPILAVTDAAVLAAHVDGTVLVVRSGATDQRAALRARTQLERVGVRILGVLLNDVSVTTTEESYYFRYIYRYYQKEAATPS